MLGMCALKNQPMRCVLALGMLLAVTSAAVSQTLDTPACKRDLAETWSGMEAALAQLKGVARAGREEKCEVYRRHVDIVAKAREVFARCKIGRDREGDLIHMDGALDDVKTTISRDCTGYDARRP